jgi:FAD binding domain
LEKQPEARHTSNTKMSLGVFLSPDSVDDAVAAMKVAGRLNFERPETQDVGDDVIAAWAQYAVGNREWLSGLGASGFAPMADPGHKADWPGLSALKVYHVIRPDGSPGFGLELFHVLDRAVRARKVAVRWESPARGLVVNPRGEVVGVRARQAGRSIAVQARRAVILAAGGFEGDAEALRTYLPVAPLAVGGNPDNTGDALRMAQEIGADLWHMAAMNGGLKMKFPDFATAFEENFSAGSFIAVDRNGRRFKAENRLIGYSEIWNALICDTLSNTWPRIPVHYVFDEKRRRAGPIVFTEFGAAGPPEMYRWSADNSAEVARGWITSADSVGALGRLLGIDADGLEDEVTRFNNAARRGRDDPMGRPPESIEPIDLPPYYAVPLWPALNNTFGGPRRNARAQVMHVSGKAIPRLYSAGELGSIFVNYPQSGANLSECIAFGRIAGENAAAESPATG